MKFKIAGFCIALLLLTTPAFAQWSFAYKQDLNITPYAVHFPTSTVGYIVGSGGIIYKSTDGGSTWVSQTSPTTQALNDVFFTDATHGFAGGAAGTIIYTTDGTNWLIHPQGFGGSGTRLTTSGINTVFFVGSSGWMGGGADNVKAELYLTTDSGTTWTAVAGANNPSTDMCNDIWFYDANKGYAACDSKVPLIMYTNDGGVTWSGSTVNLGGYPYTINHIECIVAGTDANKAAAGGWGSMIGPQPTIIVVTTDGGINFNCPNTLYPWKTYTYGNAFAKFDDGEVMLVGGGAASTAIQVSSVSPYSTWTRLPAFYGYELSDACALPGTNKVVAVGSGGCIALSTDRGQTWTFNYQAGTRFQGIEAFADAGKDKIWAVGTGTTVLTFDLAAGTVKHSVASPECWGPYDLWDIDYVNGYLPTGSAWDSTYNDVVYICGSNNYLVKSWDQGKRWYQLQHTVTNYDALNGMYWFSPDTGIVVGNILKGGSRRAEVIYKTTNGGATLDTVLVRKFTGATSYQFNYVDFARVNRNIGAVVGTYNKIRYTTNGGVTWPLATENITDSTIALNKVFMVNSTLGWAVGDKGTIVKTTNGGATWATQAAPWSATPNLIDICWRTPTWGYVSGDNALCYYTTNGGTTWTNISPTVELTPPPPGATRRAKAVFYQGAAGILWLGAEYADVLNRSDGVAGTETPKNLPFALNQNYPNPFNPSTTIEFAITIDDHVSLNVYDVSGKLVATIMNKDLKAGKYTVAFKADNLATGVYFYKLTTSTFEETRKMVLIR